MVCPANILSLSLFGGHSFSLRRQCRCTASERAFRPQSQVGLPGMLLWNKHAVQVDATNRPPFPMDAIFVIGQRSLSAVHVLHARQALIECLPKKHNP